MRQESFSECFKKILALEVIRIVIYFSVYSIERLRLVVTCNRSGLISNSITPRICTKKPKNTHLKTPKYELKMLCTQKSTTKIKWTS